MSDKLYSLYYVALLLLILSLGGCVAMSSSGGLQVRLEVERLFEEGTILEDHVYYTEGGEVEPDTIIAISKSYQLQTEYWIKREWTAKILEKAVFWMQIEEFGFCSHDGGVLIAPDGQQIGVWYSRKDFSTIRQPRPGIVEVFPFVYGAGSPCQHQAKMDDR